MPEKFSVSIQYHTFINFARVNDFKKRTFRLYGRRITGIVFAAYSIHAASSEMHKTRLKLDVSLVSKTAMATKTL